MKKKKFLFSLSALILCFTQMVVHGDWTIKNEQLNRIVNKTGQINRHVVAYIKGTDRKFVSIEGAVTYADSLPSDKDYCVVVETARLLLLSQALQLTKTSRFLFPMMGRQDLQKRHLKRGMFQVLQIFHWPSLPIRLL